MLPPYGLGRRSGIRLSLLSRERLQGGNRIFGVASANIVVEAVQE
jgi:hypothetical protein